MSAITRATLEARFRELTQQAAAIEAKAKPFRDQYEDLRQKQDLLDVQMKPVVAQMQHIEAPLFNIRQEISMIARALGGRTMKATLKG